MNPYAVLLLARTLEEDRRRSAAEPHRIHRLEPTPSTESRRSWAGITRFPRFSLSDQRG